MFLGNLGTFFIVNFCILLSLFDLLVSSHICFIITQFCWTQGGFNMTQVLRQLIEDRFLIIIFWFRALTEILILCFIQRCIVCQFGLFERGHGRVGILIIFDRRWLLISQLQFVLSEIKNSDNFIAFDLSFAAYISVLRVKDSFSVASICYSIINDQAQDSHLCIVSTLKIKISSDDLCHSPLPFPTIFQNSLAECRFVRSSMTEEIMTCQILSMQLGRKVKTFMHFKGSK